MTRILVIDDYIPIQELFQHILSKEGYEVVTASDAKEGIEKFQRLSPDLIILDLGLPGMSGMECLRKIKEMKKDVKTIILTGTYDESAEKETQELGVLDFISKGVGIEAFVRIIQEKLRKAEVSLGIKKEEKIKGKILVVDDDASVCEVLKRFLIKKGYEVLVAHNGKEAIDKIKKERPHLLLLDIKMPVMDGIETLKEVRKIDREVGIIMITANEDLELARETLKIGAFDYIAKPLNFEYLETAVMAKIAMMVL